MHRSTRRSLLLAGAALAAPDQDSALRLPRKLRLGIIGFDGHVGDVLGPLPRLPDVELTCFADAASDARATASFLKGRYAQNARRYATAQELLAREDLDVAAVCNNDGERAAAIVACLKRKLNVIAEKPLASSRADLDAVYAAVKSAGTHLGMLLPMRFSPHYAAMHRIALEGRIGEVYQIDAQKSYQLGSRPAWQKNARTYGSTILWIGIHMIDLMTFTTGRRFTEVASFQARAGFPELGDMQNVTASIFKLDNGGTGTLRMDYLRPAAASGHGDDRLRLAGSRGILEYQEATGLTLMTEKEAPKRIEELPPAGSVFLDFLRAVYLGERPQLSWPEIVAANEYTLAAHEAAEAHGIRPIRLPRSG